MEHHQPRREGRQCRPITREPEQVKAFRDTWRDGIHSYLTYLRDRLTVARDLLADSGSVFVQIGQDNCHLIRSLMDEVLVQRISFPKLFSQKQRAQRLNIYQAHTTFLFFMQISREVKVSPTIDS